MTTVLSFLFVLAVLIAVHEWGHYRMAAAVGVKVLQFSIGFGKPLITWTPKRQPLLDGAPQTTQFQIAAIPLGGFVKMLDEREKAQDGQNETVPEHERHLAFNNKPLWARAAVVAAGPAANLILAIVLFSAVNWTGYTMPQARIMEVQVGSAAQGAGLQVGDVVQHLDGRRVTDSFQLREWIRRNHKGAEQTWQIERAGQAMTLTVQPQTVEETTDMLGKTQVGRIGVVIGSPKHLVEVRYGFLEGMTAACEKTWDFSILTLQTIGRILVGEASYKNLTGPLTVAEYSGKSAAMGLTAFVTFLAVISLSLGVLNLLPLPMLDGGHLLYYLWEWVTGKPVNDWWLDKLQRFGLCVLILMMLLAFYNDLVRIFL